MAPLSEAVEIPPPVAIIMQLSSISAGPLLVGERLHAEPALLALDHAHVGEDAVRAGVGLGELVDNERVGVEAGQGDKVPREAALAQLLLEPPDGVVVHALHPRPVEAGAEVVGQHLVRHLGVHPAGKLVRLLDVGRGRLHPDDVRDGG